MHVWRIWSSYGDLLSHVNYEGHGRVATGHLGSINEMNRIFCPQRAGEDICQDEKKDWREAESTSLSGAEESQFDAGPRYQVFNNW